MTFKGTRPFLKILPILELMRCIVVSTTTTSQILHRSTRTRRFGRIQLGLDYLIRIGREFDSIKDFKTIRNCYHCRSFVQFPTRPFIPHPRKSSNESFRCFGPVGIELGLGLRTLPDLTTPMLHAKLLRILGKLLLGFTYLLTLNSYWVLDLLCKLS